MLTLQRASAGSGKTYTLTKKYIRFLISIPEGKYGEGRRRLRTDAELRDAVGRILAVTFTNKATNEMKERILQKLNELAYPPKPEVPGKLPKVDYLKEFIEEFDCTVEDISHACREALKRVLYDYSDFQISTIDSFFQNILRTFAYESDLPDSYNLIIGTDSVSQQAADGLIGDLSAGTIDEQQKAWLRELVLDGVNSGKNHWRIFQRNDKDSKDSLYKSIKDMAYQLEKEDFKVIREKLEQYAAKCANVRKVYTDINDYLMNKAIGPFVKLRDLTKQMYDALVPLIKHPYVISNAKPGDTIGLKHVAGRNLNGYFKILEPGCDPFEYLKFSDIKLNQKKENEAYKGIFLGKLADKGAPSVFQEVGEPLVPLAREMMQARDEWQAVVDSEDYKYWILIRGGFSRLAIMLDMGERISEYLNEIDAMQLADTNTMLRRIISDDDVPFIYERIGGRINHFLIDEFQDTSLQQWQNLYPLLAESMGRGNENLIIGDAKQSIYRFRNAEPKLITEIVPSSFPADEIEERGYSTEDNANHRSDRQVVEFNNFVFSTLAPMIDEYINAPSQKKIADLYSNTVQHPAKQEPYGYVNLKYLEDTEAEDDGADGGDDSRTSKLPRSILLEVKTRLQSLLERGYRQGEIAILVNTKAAGAQIIDYLMSLDAEERPEVFGNLKFVSEDSLMLKRSKAVAILIECFGIIRGIYGEDKGDADSDEFGRPEENAAGEGKPAGDDIRYVKWEDVSHSFIRYLKENPGGNLHDRLTEFFAGDTREDAVGAMMAGMQAVTLPSLVEALIESFVPEELRRSEAPFLAAFQDAILEYCDAYPTDVASMLRWWEKMGQNISISSPEGTDAVNVMTIHKSKGLEFPCVILPDMKYGFELKKEFVWMPKKKTVSYANMLPDYMPVQIENKMTDKTSDPAILAVRDEMTYYEAADKFNKAYVAFTRARNELYVIMPVKGKPDCFPKMLLRAIEKNGEEAGIKEVAPDEMSVEDALSEIAEALGTEIVAPEDAGVVRVVADLSGREFEYGVPIADVEAHLKKYREDKLAGREMRDIDDYFVNSDIEYLKYHEEGPAPRLDPADDDREDPRSEGSILHAVFENIITEEDVEKALALQRIRGKITRAKQRELLPKFRLALESVRERGWFTGRYRVFTERPMLTSSPMMRRPDRVMIDDEGNGVVVDYKFGSSEKKSEHISQIKGYAQLLLATGQVRSVEAYVWYVKEGKII